MRIMALSPLYKINNVCRNSCRLFSYKFEMTPATARSALEPADEHHPQQQQEETSSIHPNSGFRYNVCQPRTSPVEKPSTVGDIVATQKLHVKAAIEEQHLQPAMLPEYYSKSMERNALVNPQPDPNEVDRINKGIAPVDTRRFQVSKTYANAILPLKTVKLANPFPEPVKMMMSRTVSDEEKAEQMLAESKSARGFTDWSKMGPNRNYSTMVTPPHRFYSNGRSSGSNNNNNNNKKCPKLGSKSKQCPKMTLDCCPPPARTSCERIPIQIHCKKQLSPYPAYSEFCHEDIDEKPTECKLCPWKPEENPNFKPPKKKFHTAAVLNADDKAADGATPPTDMQLGDLRKPPCDRPKNRRCPPKKQEKKKEKPKKKCSDSSCVMDELLLGDTSTSAAVSAVAAMELAKKDSDCNKKSKCKLPKFKFPKCGDVPSREGDSMGCPKKKKKPLIKDCPGTCDKRCAPIEGEQEYELSGPEMDAEIQMRNGGRRDGRDKKCPKVDLTIWKDPDDGPRCPSKKGDPTKICPNDLTKKKPRFQKKNKKSTAALEESELEEIQEQASSTTQPSSKQPTSTQPTATTPTP